MQAILYCCHQLALHVKNYIVDILRKVFALSWDIRFNPLKGRQATFDGKNPSAVLISLPKPWLNRLKYLGTYAQYYFGESEWSYNIRRFLPSDEYA